MLDYSVRLKREYDCDDVEQVIIFLKQTNSEKAYIQEYQDRTTFHSYRVIRLWEENPEPFLSNPALLPLATLTQSDSPAALLEQVAQQVARIERSEQRQNISACTEILAGLRFEKDFIRQLLREDIMRESVIYQDILQQGRREGRQEGRQEGELTLILRLLTRRFGIVDSQLQEQIRSLSIDQLESLAEALLDFSTVTDLVTWLEQQNQ